MTPIDLDCAPAAAVFFWMLTGEPLVPVDELNTSSAEFGRLLMAVAGKDEDIIDQVAPSHLIAL